MHVSKLIDRSKKTIAILSSSRRNGNTAKFLELLQDYWPMDFVYLEDHDIQPYDYHYRQQDDDFHPVMQRVLAYEHIIFASPIYWYSVPPAMKAFLDRISDYMSLENLKDDGRRLRDKKAYVLTTSCNNEASKTFINMFRDTFSHLGMDYQGFIHANCKEGFIAQRERAQCEEFALRDKRIWRQIKNSLQACAF
ncbi:flavodoxin family protein [Pseudoteredinibacter isoporae]|uniref:flavodoxin family protein n=1 Tax=Pseudoteredinibacter isoporae TaxID=570281 RepID=UPI00310811FF